MLCQNVKTRWNNNSNTYRRHDILDVSLGIEINTKTFV